MNDVTERQFAQLLNLKLQEGHYERALRLFRECEPMHYDITNVLLHAHAQGPEQVENVLVMLEEHYHTHLYFQDPEIRGTVENAGVNPTELLLLHICREILKLEPAEPPPGRG